MAVTLDGIAYDDDFGYADLNFEALGGTYMSPAHGNEVASGFRLGIINGQWVLVNRHGNVFVYKGLFGINASLHTQVLGSTVPAPNQAGRKSNTTRDAKFSGAGPTWAQATKDKLTRCHFNGAGPGTFEINLPGLYHPVAMTMNIRRADRAHFFGLVQPIKDIARSSSFNPCGQAGLTYRPSGTSSNVGWGDWLDPKYAQGITSVADTQPLGSNLIAFAFDESDYVSRWLRSGHPNERGGALASPFGFASVGVHAGIGILFSKLIVTDSFTPKNEAITFTDTTNYSKAKLIANLKAKYNNSIAELNTAWQTGGHYTSFDHVDGWGVGARRGVADEDGLVARTWFGQHSPSANATTTINYHTKGSDNNVVDSTSWGGAWPTSSSGTPNLANQVKADLDQILAESVTAWLKPMRDALRARDPGVLFSAVNNQGWPARPALKDVYNEYTDIFTGGSFIGAPIDRGDLTEADAIETMEYLYSQVPKPYIANYYFPPDRADSCVYYIGEPNGYFHNEAQMQVHHGRMVGPGAAQTFTWKTSNGIFPHVGWQKWEYMDNPGEGLHWGLCSLNDNLYDGGDYTVSAPGTPGRTAFDDPEAPGRKCFTEDKIYGDMLGFGGTRPRVLVRDDLLVGANIAIKAVLVANIGGIPEPPPEEFMANLNLTITLQNQTHAIDYTGQEVRFQRSTDGQVTWANVQSNVRPLGTTQDAYAVPAGQNGAYRGVSRLTDGTNFTPEVFSNVGQVAEFNILTPSVVTLTITS